MRFTEYFTMYGCFTCLNCGKINPVKGHSYTNKYCNNSCQQQHRSRLLVQEWKSHPEQVAWRQIPDWVKKYLIRDRGHACQVCNNTHHNKKPIPLDVTYKDNNTHNTAEENLELICYNCKAMK